MKSNHVIVIATDLGVSGEAVFRHEGRVGFVPGLLPGESGEVSLSVRSGVWRGQLIRRLSDAPERVNHPCPHAAQCPGSRFGCLSRSAEIEYKRTHAQSTLKKIGGVDLSVSEFVTAGTEWGYRNKIELSVSEHGGRILIGYHLSSDAETIIPIKDCYLAEEPIRQLIETITTLTDRNWRKLLLQTTRLVIRSGDGLHLHWSLTQLPDNSARELLQTLFREYSGLVGITIAVPQENIGKQTSEAIVRTIAGELLLTGHDGVALHPQTFRQVNDAVAKRLVQAVEEWSTDLSGPLFELYGGFGPFARRIASVRGIEVHVIEKSETAIQDGQRALKKKPLPVTYYRGDVAKILPTTLPKLRPQGILLDPSYSGAGNAVIAEMIRRKPKKIGYIACHGAALARDLKPLLENGYRLSNIRLFDMFPKTPDVEWFAELER